MLSSGAEHPERRRPVHLRGFASFRSNATQRWEKKGESLASGTAPAGGKEAQQERDEVALEEDLLARPALAYGREAELLSLGRSNGDHARNAGGHH